MSYSAGELIIYDTFANLVVGASPNTMCYALDTGQFCLWNGAAFVPIFGVPRISSVASSATPSINTATTDLFEITALAVAVTGVTVTAGADGQRLRVRIKDNGTPRALAWGASFVGGSAALLTTTSTSKTHMSEFMYDTVATKWACVFADATGY
jgi:hypothetical protein